MSVVFYNNMLVIISVVGSIVHIPGSFPNSPLKHLIGLAEWNIAPLIFGSFFQVSILFTGLAPEYETIGFPVPIPQGLVNTLSALSFLLLGGRWWLRRNQARFV